MEDAQRLYEWRNDPLSRAASRRSHEIPLSEHEAVIAKGCAWIAEEEGFAVGVIRLDPREGIMELSWTIAPEYRGRGLGLQMVRLALAQFPPPLEAQIKRANLASIRIALGAGMKPFREDETYLWFHSAT